MRMGRFEKQIFLLAALIGLASAGFPDDFTRDQPDDRYRGDGDIQVGQVPVKNSTATFFENWLVSPFNFSRTSERIVDETGGLEECYATPQRGNCERRRRRWYYSVRKGRCKRFQYSGCNENGNNFRSRRECERTCVGRNRDDGYGSGSAEGDYLDRRDYRRRYPRRRYRGGRRYDRPVYDDYDDYSRY